MSPDTAALQKLLRRRSDGRYELLVIIRRDIDYEEYEARIKALEARNKSLEQQTRLALYVALQADVVDFGEIKGLAGLLAGAGTMTLANNIDNHN